MTPEPADPSEAIDALRVAVGARAAGWWRVARDSLEQVAFSATPDMPAEVALGFAEATRSVPLSRADLGIVRALADGAVAVSNAGEVPAGHGSGLWLGRFGATRSVAVPLPGRVVSVAIDGPDPPDAEVAETVRAFAAHWADPAAPGRGVSGA